MPRYWGVPVGVQVVDGRLCQPTALSGSSASRGRPRYADHDREPVAGDFVNWSACLLQRLIRETAPESSRANRASRAGLSALVRVAARIPWPSRRQLKARRAIFEPADLDFDCLLPQPGALGTGCYGAGRRVSVRCVTPPGELTDSVSKRSASSSNPSQRRSPRPRSTGTTTTCR